MLRRKDSIVVEGNFAHAASKNNFVPPEMEKPGVKN